MMIGGLDMKTAKVFTSGRSQAVRIPKEYRFDSEEVFINRVGDTINDVIAVHARSLNYTLVTNNTREFGRVPGLIVGDWLNR